MKRCTQCGILKEDIDFRESYYKPKGISTAINPGKVSRYRVCRSCESINARYRTLTKALGEGSGGNGKYSVELSKIEQFYTELEARGLRAPKYSSRGYTPNVSTIESNIDYALENTISPALKQAKEEQRAQFPVPDVIPADLATWLSDDWLDKGFEPEYLQETVYESLKAKYRPMLSVDVSRSLPVYDDTYKQVLDDILRKFDDYEDAYESNTQEGDATQDV